MSMSSHSSGSGSSQSGRKRYSMNTIESSVTRLLVSTKHLLESLTQWARQEADDKFVSDAYVKLGNDFRAATRVLSSNGVDVSDIGDVPQALRIILEAALSEPPSQDNLDRFLPNIRNIIVALLQNLKTKQTQAKALSQESSSRRESRSLPQEKGSRETLPPPAVPTPQAHTTTHSTTQTAAPIPIPISTPTITTTPPAAPSPSTKTHTPSPVKEPNPSNALSQLQNGNAMQRRASKRFSAYQYAKLTNVTPSLPRIVSSDRSILEKEAEKSFDSKDLAETSTNSRRISNIGTSSPINDPTSANIFLRINAKTKKVNVKLPVSFASLRLLFVEKFAYSPGSSSFPDIYIQDPKAGISYELEDHMLDEVIDGSVLSLNEPDPQVAVIRNMEERIQDLSIKLEAIGPSISRTIKEAISSIEIPPPAIIPSPEANDKNVNNRNHDSIDVKDLLSIKNELKAIKQLQSKSGRNIKDTVTEITKEISNFQEAGLEISKSSNRSYMESCHLKLSEESDVLLTKVDDLQDLMEALRKDVAQRGVRVSEKQLKNTFKEIDEAKEDLHKMSTYITKERSVWKKIWESELDKVCEEQQFFNLQDDLTKDLEEDLKKIEETFDLIEQCSLEQTKQTAYKRNKVVAQLYIPEPGESIHSLKEAVLSEVQALKPDHESRVEAIEKAERLREKERELMKLSKFQEELGDFVDDKKFKNSGGIEELERIRQLKDDENLKNSFGVI
ncbi:actin interacting protein 3-domain-containing protein [Scheffersomyces amazonensis]|uniref:actin interacting protein 3-domain-containing protein n=1 Tax=Scheffersomyces amazonensis TaxID=1078765 RepID=UPI00315DFC22